MTAGWSSATPGRSQSGRCRGSASCSSTAGRRLVRVTRPVPRRRPAAPACVLAAGLSSAVLAWLSLTTVQLLPAEAVLALSLLVILAAALVARHHRGRQRWLAVSGGLLAALPLLAVAAFLFTSAG